MVRMGCYCLIAFLLLTLPSSVNSKSQTFGINSDKKLELTPLHQLSIKSHDLGQTVDSLIFDLEKL